MENPDLPEMPKKRPYVRYKHPKVNFLETLPKDDPRNFYGRAMSELEISQLLEAKNMANNGCEFVFTNGVYDLVHWGHINFLEALYMVHCFNKPKRRLIVGINSDESVRSLKGSLRPINNAYSRLRLLSAVKYVNLVIPFEEQTPNMLIQYLKPKVLAKGGDYSGVEIVGGEFVKNNGGEVWFGPFIEGLSTTEMCEKASLKWLILKEITAAMEIGSLQLTEGVLGRITQDLCLEKKITVQFDSQLHNILKIIDREEKTWQTQIPEQKSSNSQTPRPSLGAQ